MQAARLRKDRGQTLPGRLGYDRIFGRGTLPSEVALLGVDGGRVVRKKVVFVCGHNAGKSRVAEAYLKELAGDRVEVSSAGTTPGDSANPAAVEALAEKGMTLREGPGVALTPEEAVQADVVVTFGCDVGEIAPDASSVEDWALTDDSGRPLKDYAQIRDAIFSRVEDLAKRLKG